MDASNAITAFDPQNLDQAERLAVTLSKSALLPDALRGKPADVLVTLITGRELGLSPMQAIRGLHVIKGKAVMSADLTVALVKKHSECLFFRLLESTDAVATYETERKGEGKTKMSFTIEQAKQAQLTGGDNWRKYPAAMLRARCASALARAVYPDLTMGVYDEDEAREIGGPRSVPPPPEVPLNEPPKQTKTEATKEALRARLQVVDVQPGQTEAEAVAASEEAPPANVPTPYEECAIYAKEVDTGGVLDGKKLASLIKGATGGRTWKEVTTEDVPNIKAAINVALKASQVPA